MKILCTKVINEISFKSYKPDLLQIEWVYTSWENNSFLELNFLMKWFEITTIVWNNKNLIFLDKENNGVFTEFITTNYKLIELLFQHKEIDDQLIAVNNETNEVYLLICVIILHKKYISYGTIHGESFCKNSICRHNEWQNFPCTNHLFN